MARHFPDWLKAYLEYTRASEAPTIMHFWTGVSTIAGALRRRVWQDQLSFQWTPNFYIILVGPAGVVTKSTTLNYGVRLLEQVPDIKFGPDSGSWQGLGDALSEAIQHFPYTDPETGEEKQIPMSAITIAASELGTFLKPDDEQAISFITNTWDGRLSTYRHKTKHSGAIEIKNPWLNIIGATTPDWMRRNVPEALIGEGLMSRIIFVYGEHKRQLVSLPARQVKPKDHYEMEKRLVEDLTQISMMLGPYQFEPSVEKEGGWMDKWYANHHQTVELHMASARYGGYRARKQTHMVKIAMVIAASRRDEMVIYQSDLEAAEALLNDVEPHMLKVFEAIGVVDEAKNIAELMTFVRAYKWITARDLYKQVHNIMSRKDYETALTNAIHGESLIITEKDGVRGLSIAHRLSN